MTSPVDAERARRAAIWSALLDRGDPNAASPRVLSEVGLRPYQTVQGIFRDKDQTQAVAPPNGVTVSVLYTGRSYDDEFDDECGIYHYPATERPGRDEAEIDATKNAGRLELPIFVVLQGTTPTVRQVRQGWIADWDDAGRTFLIAFGERTPTVEIGVEAFVLKGERRVSRALLGRPRPGQARFRFRVFKRYGPRCAVCHVALPILLEAVHLCGVAEGGGDDPRNGLVLCRNHHRAFDERLFAFEPGTNRLVCRRIGPTLDQLAVEVETLAHLPAAPHQEALEWCWAAFSRFVRAPSAGS